MMSAKRTQVDIQKDIEAAQIICDNEIDNIMRGVALYRRTKDPTKVNKAMNSYREADAKLKLLKEELKNAKE